jgi:carboxyl-terminal processing protease
MPAAKWGKQAIFAAFMRNKLFLLWPLWLALAFSAGYYFGRQNSQVSLSGTYVGGGSSAAQKLNLLFRYLEQDYVDSINLDDLAEETIEQVLKNLDPHSYYISAEELAEVSAPLEGSFEGVGIQFSIQNDTIVVISPVIDGPSERVGIKSGDRIITVDSLLVAGNGITNRKVLQLLRGEGGSKVNVLMKRTGFAQLLPFEITRGKIPINSIDAAFMVNDTLGYVKLSRFSRETYDEFLKAGENLKALGMRHIVLDLRDNGGGFMDAAIDISDEFLGDNKMIVYTEGRNRARQEYRAKNKGRFEDMAVSVIIDEGSASASEIVAGALQDNDRALIYGRRSFGKGLVQEQSNWPDGSATRLTIARYYTPSGRCIQKPYSEGKEAYYDELNDRYERGEHLSAGDSTQSDTNMFYTTSGKVVYGGGGIMPDIFIAVDTSAHSTLLSHVYYSGLLYRYSFDYADKHRKQLEAAPNWLFFDKSYRLAGAELEAFRNFVVENGISWSDEDFVRSAAFLSEQLKAGIARNIWGNEAYYSIVLRSDPAVNKILTGTN